MQLYKKKNISRSILHGKICGQALVLINVTKYYSINTISCRLESYAQLNKRQKMNYVLSSCSDKTTLLNRAVESTCQI